MDTFQIVEQVKDKLAREQRKLLFYSPLNADLLVAEAVPDVDNIVSVKFVPREDGKLWCLHSETIIAMAKWVSKLQTQRNQSQVNTVINR